MLNNWRIPFSSIYLYITSCKRCAPNSGNEREFHPRERGNRGEVRWKLVEIMMFASFTFILLCRNRVLFSWAPSQLDALCSRSGQLLHSKVDDDGIEKVFPLTITTNSTGSVCWQTTMFIMIEMNVRIVFALFTKCFLYLWSEKPEKWRRKGSWGEVGRSFECCEWLHHKKPITRHLFAVCVVLRK